MGFDGKHWVGGFASGLLALCSTLSADHSIGASQWYSDSEASYWASPEPLPNSAPSTTTAVFADRLDWLPGPLRLDFSFPLTHIAARPTFSIRGAPESIERYAVWHTPGDFSFNAKLGTIQDYWLADTADLKAPSHVAVMLGVGATYTITERIHTEIEYTLIEADDDLLSLGLSYAF
ncbi:hypothetical protein [Coraliomargarita akajimensis]|uniref:Outer membrane protein beta-barrel domain-containing protein n=1 Tax=Coraliomargarita akajimensis (strain DSM 45221 / IAM 15411 / JCM 23193 / KCTC 12865 / 04OKA010-24) TaxID=583355 RepID=D5EQT2_CORAD|nr:hypothetical protein [Coraliomargarita akajimensis]ADE53925.1 hypothetical protein Caka_0903 [Coraliomargarita akajimensis DSM 45221]